MQAFKPMPPNARGVSSAALHRITYTNNDAIHRLIQTAHESRYTLDSE